MVAQVQIWITSSPLKQSEWELYGFKSLENYVTHLANEGDPEVIRKFAYLPLVSFGTFDTVTGLKNVVLICQDISELPTEDIEGILEFRK